MNHVAKLFCRKISLLVALKPLLFLSLSQMCISISKFLPNIYFHYFLFYQGDFQTSAKVECSDPGVPRHPASAAVSALVLVSSLLLRIHLLFCPPGGLSKFHIVLPVYISLKVRIFFSTKQKLQVLKHEISYCSYSYHLTPRFCCFPSRFQCLLGVGVFQSVSALRAYNLSHSVASLPPGFQSAVSFVRERMSFVL